MAMTRDPVNGYYAAARLISMRKLTLLGFAASAAVFLGTADALVIAERGQTPSQGAQTPAPPPQRPKRPGVTTPGVRIPIAKLKPDAVYQVPGAPDWMAVDKEVWVSNEPKNSVSRLDPKSSMVMATITVGKEPCSGLAAGFGSLWVPNCGDSTVTRLNLEDGKAQATFPMTIGNSEGGVTTGAGSFWILTDSKGTLARVDPATNKSVAEIYVAPGSYAAAFGDNAVWVTSTEKNVLTRVNAQTNIVEQTIAVGPKPRFLTVGEGSVWTLNQGDGSISRVDMKTNKVVATIDAGVPGGGGEISAGEGSIWVTTFEYPITRIDPSTNKVAQQFFGDGGDSIRAGLGWIWLTNIRAGTVWRIDPRRILATLAE
jgi:YVTN family beta-propeller protein